MADEPESIVKLCDLLGKLKDQIEAVKGDLTHYANQGEDDFREKLSKKSDKMELVKSFLETLILKANTKPHRENRGRTTVAAAADADAAAATKKDSGIGSAPIERRHGVCLGEGDMPTPDAERNSLDALNRRASSENYCPECRQQMKSPMQETEGQGRISTEHEDQSKC